VFHGDDCPVELDTVLRRSDEFVQRLASGMSLDPQPHRGHPYWREQFNAFELARRPSTQSAQASTIERRLTLSRILQRLAWYVSGRPPGVRRWHPFWPDYAPAIDVIRREWLGKSALVVAIASSAHPILDWAADQVVLEKRSWLGADARSRPGRSGGALVLLESGEVARLSAVLAQLWTELAPGAAVCVYLFDRGGGVSRETLPVQLVAHAGCFLQRGFAIECCHFSAGRLRRFSQSLYAAAARATIRGGVVRIVGAVGLLLASFVLALIGNLTRLDGGRPHGYCSSITVLLRRGEGDAEASAQEATSSIPISNRTRDETAATRRDCLPA
jgi:hypothetical protein